MNAGPNDSANREGNGIGPPGAAGPATLPCSCPPRSDRGKEPGRTAWRFAPPLALFFTLVLVYNLNGRFMAGSDVYLTRFMPVNLALHGVYYLDPTKPYHLGAVVNDPGSPSHGRMISVYPTYTPTLLLPIYLPIYRWLKVPPEHYLTFYLDKWISSCFAAGAATLLFCLLRRLHGGRSGMALLVTAGMALGTSLWSIASQGSWSHGPSAFYLVLAAWALERAVRLERRKPWWAGCAGWALASAFATRQTDIFFVLPCFLLALWELRARRQAVKGLLTGVAPVAAWYCCHNLVYFGNPLATGYKYNAAQLYIPNLMHPENFFAGFFGLLFSPSLGLFTTAPVTLFALPGMAAAWRARRGTQRDHNPGERSEKHPPEQFLQRLIRLGTVFIVAQILFYACYKEWWSFWYCHRYLIDVLPFIGLCIGWFFRPCARWRALRWPLFVPALVFSMLIQFYGAFFWGYVSYYKQPGISRQLSLDPRPGKPHAGIFSQPSPHFSLDPKQHIILSEMNQFRWDWSSWKGFSKPFATWGKMRKDLCETRLVKFAPSPPIILPYGRP